MFGRNAPFGRHCWRNLLQPLDHVANHFECLRAVKKVSAAWRCVNRRRIVRARIADAVVRVEILGKPPHQEASSHVFDLLFGHAAPYQITLDSARVGMERIMNQVPAFPPLLAGNHDSFREIRCGEKDEGGEPEAL